MEAAGGIISLTWDVFDSTIRVFRFLTALVEMPRDCEKYRLQLVIEYNRVLAWGKAAGLIDVPEGSTLGAVLGADGIELVAILARIQWLLEEFRDLNARYGNELNPYADDDKQKAKEIRDSDRKSEEGALDEKAIVTDADAVRGVSALAVSYEKKKRERRHLKGTNHIRGFLSKAGYHTKDILTHPGRVRWLVLDGEEFQKLLEDLHFLTERLHELMRDHRDKRIDDITAKTYREMILARNDIQDVRDMFDAVSGLVTAGSAHKETAFSNRNDKTLQDLVQLKKLSRTSDTILSQLHNTPLNLERLSDINITVTRYTEATLNTDFEWNEDLDHPQFHPRPRGILTTPEGDIPVWIEWKSMGQFPAGSLQDKQSALRTVALAEMLHLPKPGSLPTCVGYFDDREFNDTERYGWIFKMPEGSDYDTRVVSLYALLGQKQHRPTLSQRIELASKLCSTVLNIHAVNWLHKGIFSENIVFFFNDSSSPESRGLKYDPSSPLLSGFEFSRPDGTHTTARDTDIVWDVYRWPGIQRERPTERNSRKTYDLYSLGLVLLEIAHWERLHVLMNLGKKHKSQPQPQYQPHAQDDSGKSTYPNVPLEESKNVRDWLLGIKTEGAPFDNEEETGRRTNPLTELRDLVGDRYARVLWPQGWLDSRPQSSNPELKVKALRSVSPLMCFTTIKHSIAQKTSSIKPSRAINRLVATVPTTGSTSVSQPREQGPAVKTRGEAPATRRARGTGVNDQEVM
ncbi:prion-inhibition and propagation-domain-containing protein [Apiosordaria backusii]|uniref:Prion-inhibition and propagation-domain-containing protein n=1 Tax=Apiosordaria backusii TaxID=314023 RepID=A0AA40K1J3_9PEZI|nr:prion-inhibition and propagation-domain-containing protein [Apiosordaria backusii]